MLRHVSNEGSVERNGRAREQVLSALRERGILRGTRQRLISSQGERNQWLIDVRRVLLEARSLDAVADIFWQTCGSRLPFQVGGMEVAAVPLVAAILMKSQQRGTPINGFVVRKERKTYGAGNLIEGRLDGHPIIVVDDIFNSGRSLEKVHAVLEHEGAAIDSVFVVVDFKSARGQAWRQSRGVSVRSICRLDDLDLRLNERAPVAMAPLFRRAWQFASPDPNFFHRVPKSFPATDGRRVFFGSDCGTFWCLSAYTGEVLWTFQVSSPGHKNIWSAPALYQGRVFFGAYDGNVYCLDASTGHEVWRFIGADWVGSSPALAADLGLMFIGLEFAVEGRRGSVAALDIETGVPVWEYPTRRYTHGSPTYWRERRLVACGSNDNELLLFDAPSGRLIWRFKTRGKSRQGSIRHAPAFHTARGLAVTGCADGYVYVIDVETGRERWSVETGNSIYTVPLIVGDKVFVGSTDKHLYVLDLAAQAVKCKIPMGSKVFGPPRLIRGKVYVGACDGKVYEIDPVTAAVTGTHQLPDAVTNAIVFSESANLFYALTYTNQLFALAHIRDNRCR